MDQQAIMDRLAADPAFQKASKDDQIKMAMDALSNNSAPSPNAEQTEVLDRGASMPSSSGRPFDALDPADIAVTAGEGGVQMVGAHVARKAVSGALLRAPHPVAKGIGLGLEFLGGVAGASGAGATAAGTRAAVNQALGREDKSVAEAAKAGAIEGAMGELGGRAIESGLKAGAKLVAGSKLDQKAEQDLALAEKHGVQLRPAEVSESSPAAMLEQYTRRSLVSGNKFNALDEKNAGAIKGWVEQLAKDHFAGLQAPGTVGKAVQDIIQGETIPALKTQQRKMYEVLDSIKSIKPVESQGLLDQLLSLKAQVNPKLAPQASNIIDTALDTISKVSDKGARVPKGITFSEAHDLRSVLNQIGRDHTEVLSDKVGGIAKSIANGPLLDAMETTARRSGPEVYTRWKLADQFTKDMHGLLDHAAISQAMKKSPEDVVGATFRGNQVTETKKVLNALTASENPVQAVRSYRSAAMQQILTQASVDGAFDPARLVATSKKYSPELMETTFGKKFMADYQDLLSVAQRVNRSRKPSVAGNPSETARGAQTMVEAGAAVSAGTAAFMGAPGGLISVGVAVLSIDQLARVMNSPKGIAILKRGILTKPGTTEATKLVPRIMSVALGETLMPGGDSAE
ncbi:MAG: hypothetical protein ACRCZI_15580 [Cetobacterium sp.]